MNNTRPIKKTQATSTRTNVTQVATTQGNLTRANATRWNLTQPALLPANLTPAVYNPQPNLAQSTYLARTAFYGEPKEIAPEEDAPEEAAPEEAALKMTAPEETAPKETAPEETAPKVIESKYSKQKEEGKSNKSASKKAASKYSKQKEEGKSNKSASKKNASKYSKPKEDGKSNKSASKKAASKYSKPKEEGKSNKSASKKAASKYSKPKEEGKSNKSASKKAASKYSKPKEEGKSNKSASKKAASKYSKPKEEGKSNKSASKKAASKYSKPKEEGKSNKSASKKAASKYSKPKEDGKSNEAASKKAASKLSKPKEEGKSNEKAPKESKLKESKSNEKASKESKSKENQSNKKTPKDSKPKEGSKSNEKASKESKSKESKSNEKASKESKSNEKASKESKSNEKASKKSKSKESKSNEKASKESKSKEKASKESKSKESKSNEKASKESKSKEKASKESKSKESKSNEKASKESRSKEKNKNKPKGAISKEQTKKQALGQSKTKGAQKNTKNKKSGNKNRTILLVLGICVLILILVGVILFFVMGGSSKKKPPPVLCTSPICRNASIFLKSSSKVSVDPCTDFYEHVCGNFNGNTSIEMDKRTEMEKLIRKSFTNPKLVSPARDKMIQIDKVCKEKKGSSINDIVKGDIGKHAWITGDSSSVNDILQKTLKVTLDVGIFQLNVIHIIDAKTKKTRQALSIGSSYLKIDNFRKRFISMKSAVYRAKNLRGKKSTFIKDARQANDLYNDLRNHKITNSSGADLFRSPKSAKIDWKKVAESLSKGLYLSLYDPLHMDALVFSDFFPEASGYSYLYSNNDLKNKTKVVAMAENLKKSTIDIVMESSWIDDTKKKEIVHKLEAMKHHIGYDDLLGDVKEYEKLFKTLEFRNPNNFFEMVQEAQKWKLKKVYEVISGVRKETKPLQMYDTKYSTDGNLIFVALVLLSFPSFHRELPSYFNYGGTGFAIAHEVGRSIGPEYYMKDYTGNGNMKSDPKYTETMKMLTTRLAEYYSNNFKINGNVTLEEISADLMGLRASVLGMKQAIKNEERDILLPGFEKASNEQMLFYSWAANLCEKTKKPEVGSNEVPSRVRVNGALSLNTEFAKAFQCKKDAKMNPATKLKYYGD